MSIDAIRFRAAAENAVILQVLESMAPDRYSYGDSRGEWRDAKVEDLLEVARYTRAYDALDKSIDSLMGTVSHLQNQVSSVLEKNEILESNRTLPR
jgi:hypothetical protein